MNLKTVFLTAITATKMDNYGEGIQQHHGVSIYDADLQISIDIVPAHIAIGNRKKSETLFVFTSDRGLYPIDGTDRQTLGFTLKDINYIENFIHRSLGLDAIIDSWNINENSRTLSYVIKHECSPSFINAFDNYRKMPNVFNFTDEEREMSKSFTNMWVLNRDTLVNFAKQIK